MSDNYEHTSQIPADGAHTCLAPCRTDSVQSLLDRMMLADDARLVTMAAFVKKFLASATVDQMVVFRATFCDMYVGPPT